MEKYQEKYNEWYNNPIFDEKTKEDLRNMINNEEEKKDSFYKDLEFGTAGLRGIVGTGTNRMNKYTVGKATQGLANYIVKKNGQKRGVAIAHDSRHMSKEFCEYTALVLNANGIKTYIFDSLRPTPELSYTVRKLGCISGIVITASHNPPKYNGYKVYWEDGGQITDPIDKEIITEVDGITDFSTIKTMSKEEAISKGLYNIIGEEIDTMYIEELKKNTLNPEIIQQEASDLKIVYSPLHGTGGKLAKRLFSELGYSNLYIVKEQEEPDGDFPTVSYPNPEDPNAFELALKLAKEVNADIVLANDPDADRVGLYVKDNKTNNYIAFNGNMTGLIIAEYLISQKKAKGILPENPALIKTIVSSNMTDRICDFYGVNLFFVLTGFKNIAAKIKQFEEENSYKCIMGYEESYGCLIGTHARDKDGIVADMLLCEIAAYYKKQGKTIWDAIMEMYEKYGYYKEGQIAVTLEGAEGAKKIQEMMQNMRSNPPEKLGKYNILKIMDCSTGIEKNLITGEETQLDLPKSNVLRYTLENDCWCAVRPSGTEPKIKFYIGVKAENLNQAETDLKELMEEMKKYTK